MPSWMRQCVRRYGARSIFAHTDPLGGRSNSTGGEGDIMDCFRKLLSTISTQTPSSLAFCPSARKNERHRVTPAILRPVYRRF
jgi:hypothetical protein